MDLRVLEYFLAVARAGNITKAAEQIHITQPTLSRQLADLERSLGVSLFDRGKRQILLTDAGILFQERASEIVSLLEKTRSDLREMSDPASGTVYIGCVESDASRMLPEVLGGFSALHPRVVYEIYSSNGDDIRDKIDKGELDLGILIEPIEAAKYDSFRLPYRAVWGLLMRGDNPLASREFLTGEDVLPLKLSLPSREIVQDSIAGWFGTDREHLNIFATHSLISNAVLLVEAGLCCAVTQRGCLDIRGLNGLSFVPFRPERTTGHILAWKKNRMLHTAAAMFRDYVRETREVSLY